MIVERVKTDERRKTKDERKAILDFRSSILVLILGGITLAALAVRVYGYRWGAPYSLHVDEAFDVNMVQRLDRLWRSSHSLNINSSQYGAFSYELVWWLSALTNLLGIKISLLYLGRLFSALCGALSVPVLYWLGKRFYSRWVGLLAGALYAVSVMALRDAHFYTPDTLLPLQIVLVLVGCSLIMANPSWRNYLLTGTLIGVTIATKPNGLALFLTLAVATLGAHSRTDGRKAEGGRQKAEGRRRKAVYELPITQYVTRLLAASLLAVAIFFLINPYAISDAAHYWGFNKNDDLIVQLAVVGGRLRPLYTLQFADKPPYLYHLLTNLPFGLGWPLVVASLAGVVYSGWRAWRGEWGDRLLLLGWTMPVFLVTGGSYAKFARFMLPLVPLLCLHAAALLCLLPSRSVRLRRTSRLLYSALVFVPTLIYCLAYLNIYGQPDSRLQALAWMQSNIPVGATVGVDKDAALRFDRLDTLYNVDSKRWQIHVFDPYEIDGVKSEIWGAPPVDPERTRAYLQTQLGSEYIVLSDDWTERFRAAAQEFPAQNEYYTRLLGGQAGYKLIHTFAVQPSLLGWRVDDAASELTWRLFDHPRVYVLHKE